MDRISFPILFVKTPNIQPSPFSTAVTSISKRNVVARKECETGKERGVVVGKSKEKIGPSDPQ